MIVLKHNYHVWKKGKLITNAIIAIVVIYFLLGWVFTKALSLFDVEERAIKLSQVSQSVRAANQENAIEE